MKDKAQVASYIKEINVTHILIIFGWILAFSIPLESEHIYSFDMIVEMS